MKYLCRITLLSMLLFCAGTAYAEEEQQEEKPAAVEQQETNRVNLERTTHGKEMLKRDSDGSSDSARMIRAALASLRSLIGQ